MLSERLRPKIECAAWVIEEVKKLENSLQSSTMISNGKLILSTTDYISPNFGKYMTYIDKSNNEVIIPVETVLRLHSILQFECERRGKDFDNYCNEALKSK